MTSLHISHFSEISTIEIKLITETVGQIDTDVYPCVTCDCVTEINISEGSYYVKKEIHSPV